MARDVSGRDVPGGNDPSRSDPGRSRHAEWHAAKHAERSQKAALKVEKVADKLGATVDKASAELAHKSGLLDQLTSRIAGFDVWTRAEPGSRKPRFTRDEIAAAAVKIADDEGFDALSMRRLAAELGAGTMTLYHYIHTKDELLALLNDSVMGEVVIPDGELPTEWRAAITMVANRSREALQRHPWALEIHDDPAPGPNAARHFDQSMQAVMSLDLTLGDRFELVTAVDEYVFGFCLLERSLPDEGHDMGAEMIRYMGDLISTGDYPTLAEIERAYGTDGAFAEFDRQTRDPERFSRNLDRLLDGFEAGWRRA